MAYTPEQMSLTELQKVVDEYAPECKIERHTPEHPTCVLRFKDPALVGVVAETDGHYLMAELLRSPAWPKRLAAKKSYISGGFFNRPIIKKEVGDAR